MVSMLAEMQAYTICLEVGEWTRTSLLAPFHMISDTCSST